VTNFELRRVQIGTYEITAVNNLREEDSDPSILKHISGVTSLINFTTITVAFTFIYQSVKIANVFLMIMVTFMIISLRHASVHNYFYNSCASQMINTSGSMSSYSPTYELRLSCLSKKRNHHNESNF